MGIPPQKAANLGNFSHFGHFFSQLILQSGYGTLGDSDHIKNKNVSEFLADFSKLESTAFLVKTHFIVQVYAVVLKYTAYFNMLEEEQHMENASCVF